MSRQRPPQPRGDEAELYSRLHAPLERAVRARVRGPAASVEDACSFAWEQLLRSQPERGERLFGWLLTVAVHEGWRLVRIERRAGAGGPAGLERIPAPERELENRARALEALQALAGLRPAEKRLLALRAAGYSYRELMAIERRTYTWVNRTLVRATRRLRENELGGARTDRSAL